MKFLITFASLALALAYDIIVTDRECSCSNVNYLFDCYKIQNCQWTGSVCQTTNCTSPLTTISECIQGYLCAWVNNTCQTFTKCSDYSGTVEVPCLFQGTGCDSTDYKNTTSPCKDLLMKITTIQVLYYSIDCSIFTSKTTCEETRITSCIWSGTNCRAIQCQDYNSSETCTRGYSDDNYKVQICSWANTTCTESTSLSVLTSKNCFFLTSGRATWNPVSSICSQCYTSDATANTSNAANNSSKAVVSLSFIYLISLL